MRIIHWHRFVPIILAGVFSIWLSSSGTMARGETGPALELLPWPDNASAVFTQDAMLFGDSHVRGGDDHFQLSILTFNGRYRFSKAPQPQPLSLQALTLGYEAQYLNINTTAPGIPQHLIDASTAAGEVVFDSPGWKISVIAGPGYAGSTIGGDPDAYYGRGDVLAQHQIDPRQKIVFGLDYNGNRTWLPDIPLPIFAYDLKLNDTFRLSTGFPYVAITWRPWPRLKLRAIYFIPDSGEASIKYLLFDHVQLLADYTADKYAFHVTHTPSTQRLFFSQQRLEAGLEWRPIRALRFEAAGGYAFSQEFQTGFDERNLNTLAKIAPAPYARIDLAFGF